jgi:AP-4 complex subunit sigma-1
MIDFVLVFNLKGQLRLKRYYGRSNNKEEALLDMEKKVMRLLLKQTESSSPIVSFNEHTLVYRKYASLMFVMGIRLHGAEEPINFIYYHEAIHHFVQLLNGYFNNSVREIDLMFELPRVYVILEQVVQNGHLVHSSKDNSEVLSLFIY